MISVVGKDTSRFSINKVTPKFGRVKVKPGIESFTPPTTAAATASWAVAKLKALKSSLSTPVWKSVITSKPELGLITKISAPAPPVNLSNPGSPIKISFPPPPLKRSAPVPPFKVSAPDRPSKVSAPPLPERISAPRSPSSTLLKLLPAILSPIRVPLTLTKFCTARVKPPVTVSTRVARSALRSISKDAVWEVLDRASIALSNPTAPITVSKPIARESTSPLPFSVPKVSSTIARPNWA